MIYFLLHLEETNEVIDDYSGTGSINCNLGAYFPASDVVSSGYWYRDRRLADLGGNDPGFQCSDYGSRSAVMV